MGLLVRRRGQLGATRAGGCGWRGSSFPASTTPSVAAVTRFSLVAGLLGSPDSGHTRDGKLEEGEGPAPLCWLSVPHSPAGPSVPEEGAAFRGQFSTHGAAASFCHLGDLRVLPPSWGTRQPATKLSSTPQSAPQRADFQLRGAPPYASGFSHSLAFVSLP